jgi:hypothetical protein
MTLERTDIAFMLVQYQETEDEDEGREEEKVLRRAGRKW